MLYKMRITPSLVRALLIITMLSGITAVKIGARQSSNSAQEAARHRRPSDMPQRSSAKSASSVDKAEAVEQDDETVKVETDLTNLLFTAIDKNKRFVTTLRREDIRVLEDGTPQEIFTFQRETDRPLSLAILIDTSASQELTLPEEKAAARRFVDTIIRSQKDEVAIISFTGEATIEHGLTADVGRIRRAIDRVEIVHSSRHLGGGVGIPSGTPPISSAPSIPGTDPSRMGTTAIWDAIWATSKDMLAQTSDRTRRAIILLTDGVDTSSRLKRSEAIDRAVKDDTVIYVIGIGDEANFDGIEEDTLRKLAERTGGRAYFPKDDSDLRFAFAQIEQELRSQYLLAYTPTKRTRDGSFRSVKIEVVSREARKQKLRFTYRPGYYARSSASAAVPSKTVQRP